MKRLLLPIYLLALNGQAWAETPEELFQKAENVFRFQDYKTAESMLYALLYPELKLTNPDQIMKAHEYLGACYYWLQNEKRMEEEFTVLLTLSPTIKLDPFYYPVSLIERFEGLRKRLIELRLIDVQPPPKKNVEEDKTCEKVHEQVVRRSRVASFMPFGIGQFENGEKTKGVLFMTGQAITLGTNIGAYLAIEYMRKADGRFSQDDAKKARTLRIVQYAGLGAFAALMVIGIIDSQVNFKQEEKMIKVGPCPSPPSTGKEGSGLGISSGDLCISF